MAETLLKDRRILVVEDEYLVAEAMERSLKRAGAIVIGPVPSVDEALALIDEEGQIDSAILDINLGKQKAYPLVDRLQADGTRCVFATGNDPADVPAAYAQIIRLEKPVDLASIIDALTGPQHPSALVDGKTGLLRLRDQLVVEIDAADANGQTLLAAKLYEAVDAIDKALEQ